MSNVPRELGSFSCSTDTMVSANLPWHILDIFSPSFCRCFFNHARLQPKLSMFCRHYAKFQEYTSSTVESSFLYRYHCYHLSSIFERKKDKIACPWVFFHKVSRNFCEPLSIFQPFIFLRSFPRCLAPINGWSCAGYRYEWAYRCLGVARASVHKIRSFRKELWLIR